MNVPTRLVCPHCHRHGTTSQTLRHGIKIRCPSCQKPFTYGPRAVRGPADEADQESSLPEPSRRAGVSGLSVNSQTELVQPAPEATVAKALDESRRSDKRIPLVVAGVIGASVLLGLVLLWMFVPRAQVQLENEGSTSEPETYATRALRSALASDGAGVEDEAGQPPEVIRLKRHLRDLDTKSLFQKGVSNVERV
jgi:hypothetical protein